MATAEVLDVEALLAPIAGDNPSGRGLAYEPEYDAIRAARRAEDDAPQGDWQRRAKVAEWDRVIELAEGCLRAKTKDLQVAAWLTEALARSRGFAGLRDGLRLLHGIEDRFWETFYPEIDDGDLETRHGPFLFLDATLPMLIRALPLTEGFVGQRYSHLRWQESRATDNVGLRDKGEMEALLAEGKIDSKGFDDAVAQTPRRFYEALCDDLAGAIEAFKALDRETDRRFGREAPGLGNVRRALDDCQKLLSPILAAKPIAEPDPATAPSAAEAPADGPAAADGPARAVSPGRFGAQVHDYGGVLIEFREKALELAEAGGKLQENRRKHAELLAELGRLDEEYAQISRQMSANRDDYQMLLRLLGPVDGPGAS
jgi:type VI secretion system protein ImpA